MGGGISDDLSLPTHVLERVDLLTSITNKSDFILTSSSYSLNLPPKLNSGGFPISESITIGQYLKEEGYINVIAENWSHDTIGSALFCRAIVSSMELQPKIINVVTSDFHHERVSKIFKWAFEGLSPFISLVKIYPSITRGYSKQLLESRQAKEKQALKEFTRNFAQTTEFSNALHSLFLNHANYNLSFSSKISNQEDKLLY